MDKRIIFWACLLAGALAMSCTRDPNLPSGVNDGYTDSEKRVLETTVVYNGHTFTERTVFERIHATNCTGVHRPGPLLEVVPVKP
jgi:hypothetical protein